MNEDPSLDRKWQHYVLLKQLKKTSIYCIQVCRSCAFYVNEVSQKKVGPLQLSPLVNQGWKPFCLALPFTEAVVPAWCANKQLFAYNFIISIGQYLFTTCWMHNAKKKKSGLGIRIVTTQKIKPPWDCRADAHKIIKPLSQHLLHVMDRLVDN